jgi:hypothetical protein
MNSKSVEHNQAPQDAVFLDALQALSSDEVPEVEAQIAGCDDCQHEIEAIRRITGSFVCWPTDVLRPAVSLWDKLSKGIADETGESPVVPPRSAKQLEWEEVAPGISVKILSTDTEKQPVSMLVRLAPGTDYPPHRTRDSKSYISVMAS